MIEEEKKVVKVGKTISAFFQFILDDPIMMGLCIAIVVLIILFIAVLFLGKKSDAKESKETHKEEELLKTEVNLNVNSEPVSATQNVEPSVETPEIETFTQEPAVEVPVTFEEPTKLEVPVSEPIKQVVNETVVEPVQENVSPVPSFDDFKIEAPTEEEVKVITEELKIVQPEQMNETSVVNEPVMEMTSNESNIFDSKVLAPEMDDYSLENVLAQEPVESNNIFDNPTSMEMSNPQVVESVVNPIEEVEVQNETPSIEVVPVVDVNPIGMVQETTSKEENKPEEVSVAPIDTGVEVAQEESLKDIYSFDESELPELKLEDFSRTSIIRHMPVLDTNTKNILEDKPSEDLDDLDLPKLNTASNNTGVFNALKGEAFEIK